MVEVQNMLPAFLSTNEPVLITWHRHHNFSNWQAML